MKKSLYLLSLFVFLLTFNAPSGAQDFESEPEMIDQQDMPTDQMEEIGQPKNLPGKIQMDGDSYEDEEYDTPIQMDENQSEEVYDSSEDSESY